MSDTKSPLTQQNEPVEKVGAASKETDEERMLWSARTNWKHFGAGIFFWATAGFITQLISFVWLPSPWRLIVFGLVVLAALILAAKITVRVLSFRYELSTQRLFVQRGLIQITRDQTELVRVDDVRVVKDLVDRMFDLGTVEVISTDASDRVVRIEGVSGPDQVAELVRNYMRTARKKSLFIESL